MSFVGPRPVMPISFAAYPEAVQKVIYNVKPGLTGIGSVVFRDEEQLIAKKKENGEDAWAFYENELYPFKGKLEQWYQENQSFSTDFKLLVATALVIVLPHFDVVSLFFSGVPKRNF
jgi:lipopolysaccharide/colanic/teichoic acid biosynthesis glycosyltransferase